MSANLGALLKSLDPGLRIELFEVAASWPGRVPTVGTMQEPGTPICSLATPDRGEDGRVKVAKAIEIFEQFEKTSSSGLTLRGE